MGRGVQWREGEPQVDFCSSEEQQLSCGPAKLPAAQILTLGKLSLTEHDKPAWECCVTGWSFQEQSAFQEITRQTGPVEV